MFCNSDSCDSAIGLSEHLSRPLVMEPFYFLCGPFPLLSRVRGGGFSEVRTTPWLSMRRPPTVCLSSSERDKLPACRMHAHERKRGACLGPAAGESPKVSNQSGSFPIPMRTRRALLRVRRRRVGPLSALLLLAACFTLSACFPAAQGKTPKEDKNRPPKPPNIVFIITDDLAVGDLNPKTLGHMPNLRALMERGTTFDNAFVTNALCCPSR